MAAKFGKVRVAGLGLLFFGAAGGTRIHNFRGMSPVIYRLIYSSDACKHYLMFLPKWTNQESNLTTQSL